MSDAAEPTGGVPRPVRARLEKFESVDHFVAGYSQYFFDGGMLLPTRTPRDVGARILLQLEIRGGAVVLRATATVDRIRTGSDGAAVGMVLRFDELDEQSSDLVNRILRERKLRRTSEHAAVGATPAAAPAPAAPPAARASAEPSLAREDLSAIADALDETFDSIFSPGAMPAVGAPASAFTGLDTPHARPHAMPPTPEAAPLREMAARAAAPLVPTPAPEPTPPAAAPAAPPVPRARPPLPPPSRATMDGMPAFDAAALLERPEVDEADDGELGDSNRGLLDDSGDAAGIAAAASGTPATAPSESVSHSLDDESDDWLSRAAESAPASLAASPPPSETSVSQPLGRLNLAKVPRPAATPPGTRAVDATEPAADGADGHPHSARAIVKSITGELPAIADTNDPHVVEEALQRLASPEPVAPYTRREDPGIDELLSGIGVVDAANAARAAEEAAQNGAREAELLPMVPPPPAPQGHFARLFAWLGRLFGGK